MKKFLSLLGIATLVFFISCGGGGKYSDIKDLVNNIIKNQDDYLRSLENSKNVDDVVNAMNTFTDNIIKLGEQSVELKKKYPDSDKWDREPPAELRAEFDKLNAQAEKFDEVFNNDNVKKFKLDPKVQNALLYMAKKTETAKFFQ